MSTSQSAESKQSSKQPPPLEVGENRYFRLHVAGLARSREDEFTQACFELGASGVAEDLAFEQRDLRYDPEIVEAARFDANVFFTQEPAIGLVAVLESLRARFPGLQLEMNSEENKDWLAEWKKGFVAFPFAGPFWVIPSWLRAPPEAPGDKTKHIYVEPGMAFGTGTHETTRLAAGLLIEEMSRERASSILDVGTGTGILALIAYRLGARHLIGLDIDPEARRTARENLERNAASMIQIPDFALGEVRDTHDLVIANIIDGVLLTLRHDLVRTLKPRGRMILSGVLMDRESEFYANFTSDTGLKVIKKTSEGEWSAALLERA